jgi:predicted PurR-regulated permease PerM
MIPYIGGIISALSILVATGLNGVTGNFMFSMADAWTYGIVTAGIFYGISIVFDQFIFPRIMGNAIGLNMLVSMFVVLAGGALFGIVGMVLAFPVAGSVKVILERLLQVTTSTTVDALRLPATPLRHRSTVEI